MHVLHPRELWTGEKINSTPPKNRKRKRRRRKKEREKERRRKK